MSVAGPEVDIEGHELQRRGQHVGEVEVGDCLTGGDVDGDPVLPGEVRSGGGLALGPEVGLGETPQHRADGTGGYRSQDQRIRHRVRQRIGTELETAAGVELQRRVQIRQRAGRGRDLDRRRRLRDRHAAKRQGQNHQLIPGQPGDDQWRAVGQHRERVGGPAVGIEGDGLAGDRDAQIRRRHERDAVVRRGAGAVDSRGREQHVDEGAVAGRRAGVVERNREGEGLPEGRLSRR